MLTNAQKGLLKRAQAEAGLSDEEYRDALHTVGGARTSTDPGLNDEHLDCLLKWFEAFYWSRVDNGQLIPSVCSRPVFGERGYWARKNTRGETSRDRFTGRSLADEISALESELLELDCSRSYCLAIRRKIIGAEHGNNMALWKYKGALERTLKTKRLKAAGLVPF